MISSKAILHYIYDPLCGWCYGPEPLVQAAFEADFNLVLHAGGLWDGQQKIDPTTLEHIRYTDSSITSFTGQKFGNEYLVDFLENPPTVVWSQPPIDAILAAGKLSETPDKVIEDQLRMNKAIQSAYYISGRNVCDLEVLLSIAKEAGFDTSNFEKKLNPNAAARHIKQTRKLMKTADVSGFPNFVIEREDKTMHRIDHTKFYGKPDKFLKALSAMM